MWTPRKGVVILGQVRSIKHTGQGSPGHSGKFSLPEFKLCRAKQPMETPSDCRLLSVGDFTHSPGSGLRSSTGLFISHSSSVIWPSKHFRLLSLKAVVIESPELKP